MKAKDRKQKPESRPRLLTLNDPQSMRINSELALEIGLNESIMLLQIEYLIGISGHEHEGRQWTYQTLEELREKYFRWWSVATISRTLTALKDAGLIFIDNFNKRRSDRTQWFALNPEGISKLKSITIFQYEKCTLQDEKSIFQSATSILQDETALPETSPDTTTEIRTEEEARKEGEPPEWLDPKAWNRWLRFRKEINHPVKTTQAEAQFIHLEKLKARGHPPEEVIQQSIAHGWQGLFEIKPERNGNEPRNFKSGKPQVTRDFSKYPDAA